MKLRINLRTILVLMLVLVCGIAAAVGLTAVLRPHPGAVAEPETVPVVVAVRNLDRFQELTSELIQVKQIRKDSLPNGHLSRFEDALDRTISQSVGAGEAILESNLGPKWVRPLGECAIVLDPTASPGLSVQGTGT